jgi:hypothetical protein
MLDLGYSPQVTDIPKTCHLLLLGPSFWEYSPHHRAFFTLHFLTTFQHGALFNLDFLGDRSPCLVLYPTLFGDLI